MEFVYNRIYMVRHGQTAGNRDKVIVGRLDVPLTEEGEAQARALAPRFADLDLPAVFTSTQQRAIDTARLLLGGRAIEPVALDGLCEQHYGDLEGQSYGTLNRQDAELATRYYANPAEVTLPGGEPFDDFQTRVIDTFERSIQAPVDGRNILIVAHGGSLRVLIAHLLQVPVSPVFFRLWLDNASVTRIDQLNGGFAILKEYNRTEGSS